MTRPQDDTIAIRNLRAAISSEKIGTAELVEVSVADIRGVLLTLVGLNRAVEARFDAGDPSIADYDTAIQALADARTQIQPDGRLCAVCHDSDHQAFECRHNPLRHLEMLRLTVLELRDCLECLAHPTEGWPLTQIAARFEDSRDVVPDDEAWEDGNAIDKELAAVEMEADWLERGYPRQVLADVAALLAVLKTGAAIPTSVKDTAAALAPRVDEFIR